jgi:hypothetical protein
VSVLNSPYGITGCSKLPLFQVYKVNASFLLPSDFISDAAYLSGFRLRLLLGRVRGGGGGSGEFNSGSYRISIVHTLYKA